MSRPTALSRTPGNLRGRADAPWLGTPGRGEGREWLHDMLVEMLLCSGIGYVAAAYAASRILTKATPGRPRKTPADHGFPWEALSCRTFDGHRLAGWAVAPVRGSPRATVALFHGVYNSREQTLGRLAFLAAAGYRCVAFDHRAHGESTGRRTSFGYYESRDVVAVLDFVRERWPHEPRAALGISMGAAALCYAAEQARAFDAIILESVYHDIGKAFASHLDTYPRWFRHLDQGILWWTERRLGVRMGQLAPVRHMRDFAPTPVLLLTGNLDPHAPPDDAQHLFDECRGPRELCLVPNAGHRDLFESGGKFYKSHVLDFLERRLAS